MNLLEVRDLVCGYDGEEVIKGLSFSVQSGEFLGILGPNGAGKTTLFRAITGVLKHSSGKIYYQEKELLEIPAREIAREIAVLPQILEISFSFSVEEFVRMGRFSHRGRLEGFRKEDEIAVEKAMETTGILNLKSRSVNQLSGGERQRVLLAQALAQEPSLLLLDEPTAHLDISHQVEICDLIKNLNREKSLTVIMVLHDLNLASDYCDQLILINKGKLYKIGPPEEVLTYQIIEEVYKTTVVVRQNPVSFRPHIFLVPKERIT
ncbi:hypothetical protein AUJ66_04055 [Candidatus Desantisbacteria bacterium CG1_02_38_46]|uniref:Heme ABC transporter ATP-binding protein n=2 Tax=unclassified Candidatus Desantisiibacteriota TaxID=3106372 RepID=A0A2H9PBJ6_9BACT|nr:MAG: hypothetical protein AUJ66_04055 [Candidatus Desantisbacteria bacterium CG1_02_38_46]PIZ16207.1 MAG: heme ABC transporter ATP-binding protein [Candidatus Desantisbacteria bacterium CG_4_10_14_0_8_um_filter_39_17]